MWDEEQLLRLAAEFLGRPSRAGLRPLEDWLRAVDLGRAADEALAVLDRSEDWTTLAVIEDPRSRVNLSLFLTPAGRGIPLHDHPGLYGMMRVLRGRARLLAWDWDPQRPWARQVADVEVDADSPLELVLPALRNLHRIEALEDCAFLDLFVPSYGEGRRCCYYRGVEARESGIWELEPLKEPPPFQASTAYTNS